LLDEILQTVLVRREVFRFRIGILLFKGFDGSSEPIHVWIIRSDVGHHDEAIVIALSECHSHEGEAEERRQEEGAKEPFQHDFLLFCKDKVGA
jgi:hypothetical protein